MKSQGKTIGVIKGANGEYCPVFQGMPGERFIIDLPENYSEEE